MEGMSITDITPVRIFFSEMHLALARGDIDAYVGAEPGPGVSLASGVGKLVEYPYSTDMGSLNMVFGAHRDTATSKPDLTEADPRDPPQGIGIRHEESRRDGGNGGAKLGQKKEAIEISVPNVELTWKFGPKEIEQSKIYASHMLALKQIKQLPDFATFFDTSYVVGDGESGLSITLETAPVAASDCGAGRRTGAAVGLVLLPPAQSTAGGAISGRGADHLALRHLRAEVQLDPATERRRGGALGLWPSAASMTTPSAGHCTSTCWLR